MRLLKFLTFLFCIFHASTSISADLCKEYPREHAGLLRCQGNKCPNVLLTSPLQFKNLKLVAACDYEIRDSEPRLVGDFFFQGEQIIWGTIRREPSEFIDEFTLRGEKRTSAEKRSLFFRDHIYLQFNDQLMAEKEFKAPKSDKSRSCWEAKAQLKIFTMLSVFGWDNREGDFPRKYTVLTVEPYRKCLHPTPDPFAKWVSFLMP